jgi:thioredoxin-like negative regulator of GroEL
MFVNFKMPIKRKKSAHRHRSRNKRGGATEKFFYKGDRYVKELTPQNIVGGKKIQKAGFGQGKPGLVMWYADWCPHCSNQQTQQFWKDCGKRCGDHANIAAMNCAQYPTVSQSVGISGYPTITFVDQAGNIDAQDTYSGQREMIPMLRWLCEKHDGSHCPWKD